jgi:hypothetical protein
MKLNLLPTYVGKERANKTAVILSILMVLASVLASLGMIFYSQQALAKNRAAVEAMRPRAQATVDTAAQADTIVQQAQGIMTNTQLAERMIAHNAKYPRFYTEFFRFIPPFYRLTSISAVGIDDKTSTVTMTGTLQTYQQYSDLVIAMLRNPKVSSVARAGFVSNDMFVPNISSGSQLGEPIRPGEQPIPDDSMQRLAFFEARGSVPPAQGVGGFGQDPNVPRTAMPNSSLVTVVVTVAEDLRTPNPRQTLGGGGGGAAAPGGFGGGPPVGFGGPPGGFGGPPPGAVGTGGPAGAAAGGPAGRRGGQFDDE